MKKILLISIITFAFTACNKCVECTIDDYEYQIGNETYGDQIIEICSDNFESTRDFNEYIEDLEDEYDYDCTSDFWN